MDQIQLISNNSFQTVLNQGNVDATRCRSEHQPSGISILKIWITCLSNWSRDTLHLVWVMWYDSEITYQNNHGQPWTGNCNRVNNGSPNNCVFDLCIAIIIASTLNLWKFSNMKIFRSRALSIKHQFEKVPDVCRLISLPDFLLKEYVWRVPLTRRSLDPLFRVPHALKKFLVWYHHRN